MLLVSLNLNIFFKFAIQNTKIINMITEIKERYMSPETEILEVDCEDVICVSGGEYPEWEQENI